MADFLIQATISNLAIATLVAVIAWWVQHRIRSASLANLLWALVLIKLITPPIFSVPVLQIPSVSQSSAAQTGEGAAPFIHKDVLRDEPIPDWTAVESTATLTTEAHRTKLNPQRTKFVSHPILVQPGSRSAQSCCWFRQSESFDFICC